MGTRYVITVICPGCGAEHFDVWYAPTCDAKTFTCPDCGLVIDLERYTGISEGEASNCASIEALADSFQGLDIIPKEGERFVVEARKVCDAPWASVLASYLGSLGMTVEVKPVDEAETGGRE